MVFRPGPVQSRESQREKRRKGEEWRDGKEETGRRALIERL